MQYLVLMYGDERALSERERQACDAASAQLAHAIKASGQYLAANPLPDVWPPRSACATANGLSRMVRSRNARATRWLFPH